jgi:hypothetical protein
MYVTQFTNMSRRPNGFNYKAYDLDNTASDTKRPACPEGIEELGNTG